MPKTGYGNHWIGSWHRSVNNGPDGDGGIMSIDNEPGWGAGWPIVFVGGSDSSGYDTTRNEAYVIEYRGPWELVDVNDWTCKTGGKDWTDCGQYDGARSVTIEGVYHYVRKFDTMFTCGGDSGGPVYVINRGYGIVKAGGSEVSQRDWRSGGGINRTTRCFADTYVMALDRPFDALNVRLVTSNSP